MLLFALSFKTPEQCEVIERYTFVWRKSVEKQLAKVKEKVLSAISITSLEALEQHLAETEAQISFA